MRTSKLSENAMTAFTENHKTEERLFVGPLLKMWRPNSKDFKSGGNGLLAWYPEQNCGEMERLIVPLLSMSSSFLMKILDRREV